MASLSITVSSALDLGGLSYPTLWNAFNWDEENWNQVADLGTFTTKVVDSDGTPTSDMVKYILHAIDVESTALDSDTVRYLTTGFSDTVSTTSGLYSLVLTDANGYRYVFVSDASDGEDRDDTSWTESSLGTDAWVESTPASTSWSAA